MTTLTRWNPLKEMEDMENRLSRMMRLSPVWNDTEQTLGRWMPEMDFIERKDEYVILADLPGMTKKDVTVMYEAGELVIKGKRQEERESELGDYLIAERSEGNFMRSFRVPSAADESKIRAECKDGVLTVHVPKKEEAKPRVIDIKES